MKTQLIKFLLSYRLLFWVIFYLPTMLFAQQYISGSIANYTNQQVYIFGLQGERQYVIDSTQTNQEGSFSFTRELEPGMYQIQTQSGARLELIFQESPVQFVAPSPDLAEPVHFVQSPENTAWQAYRTYRNQSYRKEDLLKPLLQQYDKSTVFYGQAMDEFNRVQDSVQSLAAKLIRANQGSFVARLIQTDLRPVINLNLPFSEQRDQIIEHFFDLTDFSDTLLIASNILTTKLIDYLSLYQRPDMDMNQTQFAFMKGVDEILNQASVNNTMYAFVLEYLLDGFAHLGLNAVTDYLSTLPHFNAGCIDTETLMKIERIVNPYRKIVIGAQATPIEGQDINGNPFTLDTIAKPHTLVVFWSLTCPHCLELMPKLKAFQQENPTYALVSVILSPNNSTLKEYILHESLHWTHVVEGEGWDGPLVQAYNVYGTPTIFVLDKDKKIEAKPSGIEELRVFANSAK